VDLGTIDTVYYEGGEPFLFYPLLIRGIREANRRNFTAGVVTNGFFATSDENARLFFEPLVDLDISDLSISDDVFHYEEREENPARRAYAAACGMGLKASVLALDPGGSGPQAPGSFREEKTGVITGGGIMFRGRAAAKLSPYARGHDWREFTTCPYEDLVNPGRLHVDAYGNLQICQGISIGNLWEKPLGDLIGSYNATDHPICGPLVSGGPAQLARVLRFTPPETVADACHLCYLARKANQAEYPGILTPGQVYCDS
jgi:hypothetical protein